MAEPKRKNILTASRMVERPRPKIFLYLYSEIVKINSYTP